MTQHQNDGGPAFPNLAPNSSGPHIAKRDSMTLRDWFAGQALAGYIVDPASCPAPEKTAEACYRFADAMLAERAKREAA